MAKRKPRTGPLYDLMTVEADDDRLREGLAEAERTGYDVVGFTAVDDPCDGWVYKLLLRRK